MAGPEVALVGAVAGAVAKPVCEPLCGFVCSKINNAFKLPSNLDVLFRGMEGLVDLRNQVKEKKEAAEKEGNNIRAPVVTWLADVQNLEARFDPIREEMENSNYKKPSACFLNCCKRYKESTDVDEILKEILRLLEAGIGPDNVVFPTIGAITDEHLDVPSIRSQTTASKALAETMRLLQDEKVQRIGIWGLGGIGKSALVRTLYNELNESTSTHPFGIVIYATVSKDPTKDLVMKEVQTQIAQRLKLEVKAEESVQGVAIRLCRRLMNEDKFLLILDDVWEIIDLYTLGVPRREVHKGCKIIFTCRSEEVCRYMEFDKGLEMNRLTDADALQLFCQKADILNNEDIKPFAEEIVEQCRGLPLAIITMGAAMRSKTEDEWKSDLEDLRTSVFSVGSDERVYESLKWSYDYSSLDYHTKSCFLLCSLFPKASSIKISELEQYLLAEGVIGKQHPIRRLIDKLKKSGLLEDGADVGTVKMHDIVRDVAKRIASSSEDGDKSLVLSGIGYSRISDGDFSNSDSLKRVSFMCNEITSLPDCEIKCSKALTLLLQGNQNLKKVPERFLQGFVALKVLNLSETNIESLPVSIIQLGDLRALLLRNCFLLGELPSFGELKLEMIDLSGTRIRKLSKEMGNLSNLRQLHLYRTHFLETIQAGFISDLSCLEFLDMAESAYELLFKTEEEGGGKITFEELRDLQQLRFSSIRLIPRLNSEDLSWINKLEGFQISIGPTKVIPDTKDKRVIVDGVDFSNQSIKPLWGIGESLELNDCRGLDKMIQDLVSKSVGCFSGLKSLAITGSKSFDRRVRGTGGLTAPCDLLPNLEKLTLSRLNLLESISELVLHLGLKFSKLKLIEVSDCSDMKYLLSCGDFIQNLPDLEIIKVSSCKKLDKLFNYDPRSNMAQGPIVPFLRILELKKLRKLRTLCRREETWPCLKQVEVLECDCLKRLPLTNQNAGTVEAIIGESEWWDALEWDDDETKSSLLPYFHPARDPNLM
jgi:disease resistance protein RPS2